MSSKRPHEVIITKVPLKSPSYENVPASPFPPMKELYLDLLKNKERVPIERPNFLNNSLSECTPPSLLPTLTSIPEEQPMEQSFTHRRFFELQEETPETDEESKSSHSDHEHEIHTSDDEEYSEAEQDYERETRERREIHETHEPHEDHEAKYTFSEYAETEEPYFEREQPDRTEVHRLAPVEQEPMIEMPRQQFHAQMEREPLTFRKRERPLEFRDPPEEQQEPFQKRPHRVFRELNEDRDPPTLSELNVSARRVYPHVDQYKERMEIENEKREILNKFEITKRNYPNATPPELSIHQDLETLKTTFYDWQKNLRVQDDVVEYRMYMVYFFVFFEWAGGKYLKLPMKGFARDRMSKIDRYDRYLYDLGLKHYVDQESEWSVEVRLIGMMIMDAAFFIVGNYVMNQTGDNINNMLNSMNSGGTKPKTDNRRPMKGPSF